MEARNHVEATRFGGLLCLRVVSRRLWESEPVAAWESEVRDLVGRVQPDCLVMDLSRVERCSKEAINSLIQIQRRLEARGARLALCGLSPRVADSFRVMNLVGTVFCVHASWEEALGALAEMTWVPDTARDRGKCARSRPPAPS